MKHETIYKLVNGNKSYFEKESKKLTDEGYIIFSNLNTIILDGVVIYSVLMTKYVPIKPKP